MSHEVLVRKTGHDTGVHETVSVLLRCPEGRIVSCLVLLAEIEIRQLGLRGPRHSTATNFQHYNLPDVLIVYNDLKGLLTYLMSKKPIG